MRILSAPGRLIGDVFALIYRAAPGYEAHLSPTATLALSGDAGDYWLNTVVISDGSAAETALRQALTTLHDRSLPGWVLHDDSLTPRLAPVAQEFDLADGGTVPFMVYRPEQAPPLSPPDDALTVVLVTDPRALAEANRITAAAFASPREAINRVWGPLLLETPGLDIFLGRRSGMAISVVMTVSHGSLVGIWTMGTVPEHQRSGAGRRLLNAVLRHHLERGATACYLAAFEAGQRLYEQTGFHTEAVLRLWIRPV